MEVRGFCDCRVIAANDPRFSELAEYIDALPEDKKNAVAALGKAKSLFGSLPAEVLNFIADKLGVPEADVLNAAVPCESPCRQKGRHHVAVCLGTACYVKGAQAVLEKVCDTLGISIGETTADGEFTLEATRCHGFCALAPVLMIDDDVYGKLTDVGRIPAILDAYRGQGVR